MALTSGSGDTSTGAEDDDGSTQGSGDELTQRDRGSTEDSTSYGGYTGSTGVTSGSGDTARSAGDTGTSGGPSGSGDTATSGGSSTDAGDELTGRDQGSGSDDGGPRDVGSGLASGSGDTAASPYDDPADIGSGSVRTSQMGGVYETESERRQAEHIAERTDRSLQDIAGVETTADGRIRPRLTQAARQREAGRQLGISPEGIDYVDAGWGVSLTPKARRGSFLESYRDDRRPAGEGLDPGGATSALAVFDPGELSFGFEGDRMDVSPTDQAVRDKIERDLERRHGVDLDQEEDIDYEETGDGVTGASLTKMGEARMRGEQSEGVAGIDADVAFTIPETVAGHDVPFFGGERAETALAYGSATYSDWAESEVENMGLPEHDEVVRSIAEQDEGVTEEDLERNNEAVDTFFRSAFEVANIPETTLGLKEVAEESVAQDRAFRQDRGLEYGQARAGQAAGAVESGVEYARENPAQAGAMVGGSLASSALLMGGAAKASSRLGTASRFAIQPGEEIAGRAGYYATRAVRGERSAERWFPNKEPLLLSEEAAIRGTAAAGRGIARGARRAGRAVGDVSVPRPSVPGRLPSVEVGRDPGSGPLDVRGRPLARQAGDIASAARARATLGGSEGAGPVRGAMQELELGARRTARDFSQGFRESDFMVSEAARAVRETPRYAARGSELAAKRTARRAGELRTEVDFSMEELSLLGREALRHRVQGGELEARRFARGVGRSDELVSGARWGASEAPSDVRSGLSGSMPSAPDLEAPGAPSPTLTSTGMPSMPGVGVELGRSDFLADTGTARAPAPGGRLLDATPRQSAGMGARRAGRTLSDLRTDVSAELETAATAAEERSPLLADTRARRPESGRSPWELAGEAREGIGAMRELTLTVDRGDVTGAEVEAEASELEGPDPSRGASEYNDFGTGYGPGSSAPSGPGGFGNTLSGVSAEAGLPGQQQVAVARQRPAAKTGSPEARRAAAERSEARASDSERDGRLSFRVQPALTPGFRGSELSLPGAEVVSELAGEAERGLELEGESETGGPAEFAAERESELEMEAGAESELEMEAELGIGYREGERREPERRTAWTGSRAEGEDDLALGWTAETVAGFAGLGIAGGEGLRAERADLEAQGDAPMGEFMPSFDAGEAEQFKGAYDFLSFGSPDGGDQEGWL